MPVRGSAMPGMPSSSYFVFRTLREKGILPAGLRFQISIPMVNSVVRPLYFPDARDLDRVRPGFEESLATEIEMILKHIPHRDLAIQWDCAWWRCRPSQARRRRRKKLRSRPMSRQSRGCRDF